MNEQIILSSIPDFRKVIVLKMYAIGSRDFKSDFEKILFSSRESNVIDIKQDRLCRYENQYEITNIYADLSLLLKEIINFPLFHLQQHFLAIKAYSISLYLLILFLVYILCITKCIITSKYISKKLNTFSFNIIVKQKC